MGILNDLLAKVTSVSDALSDGSVIRDALLPRESDIMEFQYEQLFAGLTSSGEDIRPYYSEDLKPGGYFYTVDSAKRYAEWKESMTYPYSVDRNPDAPNLYINGRFHSELAVEFGSDAVGVVGATGYAQKIIAKYGLATFGLMKSNWMRIFVERGAYDELMTLISKMLW